MQNKIYNKAVLQMPAVLTKLYEEQKDLHFQSVISSTFVVEIVC